MPLARVVGLTLGALVAAYVSELQDRRPRRRRLIFNTGTGFAVPRFLVLP